MQRVSLQGLGVAVLASCLASCVIPPIKYGEETEKPFQPEAIQGIKTGESTKHDVLELLNQPDQRFNGDRTWVYSQTHTSKWFYMILVGAGYYGGGDADAYKKEAPFFLVLDFDETGLMYHYAVTEVNKTCRDRLCVGRYSIRSDDVEDPYSGVFTLGGNDMPRILEFPGRCHVYLVSESTDGGRSSWFKSKPRPHEFALWIDGWPRGYLVHHDEILVLNAEAGVRQVTVRAAEGQADLDVDCPDGGEVAVVVRADQEAVYLRAASRESAISQDTDWRWVTAPDFPGSSLKYAVPHDLRADFIEPGFTTRGDLDAVLGNPQLNPDGSVAAYVMPAGSWHDLLSGPVSAAMPRSLDSYVLFAHLADEDVVDRFELLYMWKAGAGLKYDSQDGVGSPRSGAISSNPFLASLGLGLDCVSGGCVNGAGMVLWPTDDDSHDDALLFKSRPETCAIYIFSEFYLVVPWEIELPGNRVARIDGSSFIRVDLEPGQHRVIANNGLYEESAETHVDCEPQQIHFLELGVDAWSWTPKPEIDVLAAEKGIRKIRERSIFRMSVSTLDESETRHLGADLEE